MLLAIGGGAAQSGPHDAARPTATPPAIRTVILRNLPTNSNQRCVGISIVAEALLDGVRADGTAGDNAEDVAHRIYGNLLTNRQLPFQPRLLIGEASVAIESAVAIEKLTSLVTDLYKDDFLRLSKTRKGRRKLLAAEDAFVATREQLEKILDAEPDQTDAFLGSGTRTFPDGRLDQTHHAFLIVKMADGQMRVFDPNEPGSAIACKLTNRTGGVEVEWTSQYRDTGMETTQRYQFVHKDIFFRLMLGQ